jgi:coronin-7
MPLVDKERSIVYLAGRGDMSLRWVEVGGPAVFTEGESIRVSSPKLDITELIPIDETSGSTPFPSQIAGAALLPPHQMDLMKAEINRLVVLTNDAVVPVPINVPRRQYIDFHSDLYPVVSNRGKLF